MLKNFFIERFEISSNKIKNVIQQTQVHHFNFIHSLKIMSFMLNY